MSTSQQRKYSIVFGSAFIIILFAAFLIIYVMGVYKVPMLMALFEFFFRTVLAAAVAGVTATIPGWFELDWNKRFGLRAGGAFAVFVLVFLVNPPGIIGTYAEEAQVSDLFIGCDQLRGGVEPSGDTENYCRRLAAEYPDHWQAPLGMAKLMIAKKQFNDGLVYALDSLGLFHKNNDLSVLQATRNAESDVHYDALAVLHTFKMALWGVRDFSLSHFISSEQAAVGAVNVEELPFLLLYSQSQNMANFLLQPEFDEFVSFLLKDIESSIDYEYFYRACMLSWIALIQSDVQIRNASLDQYKKFKIRLNARDGASSSTQRDLIQCLERDFGSQGRNCGRSIGAPTFCPIFTFLYHEHDSNIE